MTWSEPWGESVRATGKGGMSIEVIPLSAALGAEITGVDLAREISAAQFDKIRRAWLDHKVIVFRGQVLSPEDQLRYARLFGNIQVVRSATHIVGRDQTLMHVANRDIDGKPGILPDGEMQFHTDQCYYEKPARATLLYAMEIPKTGGNTRFLNTAKAYAALPEETKIRLADLNIENIYDYDASPTTRGHDLDPAAPRFVHPAIIAHPDTGEPVLYANRLISDRIVGLERDESDRLLADIFDHAEQDQFIYEHVWRVGDLIMWDNFATMHARTDFDPNEARVLRRTAVEGPRPIAYGAVS